MNKFILLSAVLISTLFTIEAKAACPFAVFDPPSNIRSGPGTSYGLVTSLDYLTQVNVVTKQGLWYKINYPVQGWVHASQIRPDCSITGPLNTAASKPKSNSEVSGYCIYKGEAVPDRFCY